VGKYLDILKSCGSDISDQSVKSSSPGACGVDIGRFDRFCRDPLRFCQAAADALERRCPDHVHHERWQQAIADGHRFLGQWYEKAAELSWTARDLFGLPPVPERPTANYQRLSRYDQIGLIWLLQGKQVLALTEDTAAIENPSGSITVYRRHNKPAMGPLGDSLEELDPRSSYAENTIANANPQATP
jgi:hypothetical protein